MSKRIPELDILRGTAIILVLLHHSGMVPDALPGTIRTPLFVIIRAGWIGVDLFFVLSGFLVSGLLFDEYAGSGTVRLKRFFTRRGWKIYPSFYAMILVSIPLQMSTGRPFSVRSLLSELLFIQNYSPGLWGHTWSLAVEEHFYLLLILVWAVILLTGYRIEKHPLATTAVIASVCCMCLGLRSLMFFRHLSVTGILTYTHLRMDSLLIGVAISYWLHFHRERFLAFVARYRMFLFLLPVGLILPLLYRNRHLANATGGLTMIALAFGAILVWFLTSDSRARKHASRALAFLTPVGVSSYSIYLWHIIFPVILVPALNLQSPSLSDAFAKYALNIAAPIAAGMLLSKFLEMPLLRFRDRNRVPRKSLPRNSVQQDGRSPAGDE